MRRLRTPCALRQNLLNQRPHRSRPPGTLQSRKIKKRPPRRRRMLRKARHNPSQTHLKLRRKPQNQPPLRRRKVNQPRNQPRRRKVNQPRNQPRRRKVNQPRNQPRRRKVNQLPTLPQNRRKRQSPPHLQALQQIPTLTPAPTSNAGTTKKITPPTCHTPPYSRTGSKSASKTCQTTAQLSPPSAQVAPPTTLTAKPRPSPSTCVKTTPTRTCDNKILRLRAYARHAQSQYVTAPRMAHSVIGRK